MKIKCLIIDDEPFARRLVASHASKIETLELVGECSTAVEAASILTTKAVDLIFLDVQMPELSGLDLIRTLKNPPAIILITAYRDFAVEAFDLDVLDYLLKPVSFERFLKSVNKYFDSVASMDKIEPTEKRFDTFIYIKADKKDHKILLEEIIYIESLDDYVKVVLKDKTLITHESISSLEEKLPSNQFVRIHRSFLVALKQIQTVSGEEVQVGGKVLPFGRVFKKSALAAIYRKPV